MYRLLRNTHLFAGLFFFLSMLMYGLSSVYMTHRSWFGGPRVSARTVRLEPGAARSPRVLARHLMERHGLRGAIHEGEATPGGFRLMIARPGTIYRVEYWRQRGEARIESSVSGVWGTLAAIHDTVGYRHRYVPALLWGLLGALASVGLLALSASGFCMWFQLPKERGAGAAALLIGFGYSLTLMLLLRLA